MALTVLETEIVVVDITALVEVLVEGYVCLILSLCALLGELRSQSSVSSVGKFSRLRVTQPAYGGKYKVG
jgi:hypothetical protein